MKFFLIRNRGDYLEQLQITEKNGRLHVKAPHQHNGLGRLYIYNQSRNEVDNDVVYVDNGVFEIDRNFSNIRSFLKLIIHSKTYVGSLRHLPLNSVCNLRDLGGYEGKYGSVKWRLLYRSDALCNLSVKDEILLKNLAIKTVTDFRSPQEIKRCPDYDIDETFHYEIDPSAFVAAKASEVSEQFRDQWRVQSLEKLLHSADGIDKLNKMKDQMIIQMHDLVAKPISQKAYSNFLKIVLFSEQSLLFHCQGGKDRTGWAAAILLGLLGIDNQTIMQDYLLTKKYNEVRNAKRMESYAQYTSNELILEYLHLLQLSKKEYLNAAFEALNQISDSYEDYANRYLDFNGSDVQELRKKYLE